MNEKVWEHVDGTPHSENGPLGCLPCANIRRELCGDRSRCTTHGCKLRDDGSCVVCVFRERKAEKRREAAKRRRESPRAIASVDVDEAVKRLREVPVLRETLGKRRVKVDVTHRARGCCGGQAFQVSVKSRRFPRYAGRVYVYGGPEATPQRVLEVVIHELCHLATPGCSHNERFRRVFQRAVLEAWGIAVSIDLERGHHENASYAMGEVVTAKLSEMIQGGVLDVSVFAPRPVAKKSRTERANETVEKRATHALKMLSQAEQRLKIAKIVHKRWATKVRYYERAAARRGK